MAMGDPNWVSLLPGPPTENAIEAGNKGVLAGLQIGQAKAVRGALQNLDINSPASTNDAVGALVRAGALDQATGLMNLNFTRDLRSRVGPLMDKLSGLGGQQAPAPATTSSAPAASPNGDTMTPDQLQHVTDTMGQGVDALKQIRALPQEQRAAAFQQARQAFVDRGIPPQAVDAAGRDLSDAGLDQQIAYLSAHGDHFGAQAQGQPSTAPTMAHPSQYAWASTLLSDPSMQLGLAMAKAAGIDLSGLTDTAKALVAPEIAKQAEAAHAQEIAQGSTAGTNLANTNPATAPAPFKGGVHGTLPNGQPGWVMGTGAAEGQTAEANAGALGAAAGQNGGQTLFDASGAPHVVPVQGAGPTAAGYQRGVERARQGQALVTIQNDDGTTTQGTLEEYNSHSGPFASGGGGAAPVHHGTSAAPGVVEAQRQYPEYVAKITAPAERANAQLRYQQAVEAIRLAQGIDAGAFTGAAAKFAPIAQRFGFAGNFANNAAAYQQLTQQLFNGQFTTLPRITQEFETYKQAAANVNTPRDAAVLSFATIAAMAHKQAAFQQFAASHPEIRTAPDLNAAFLRSPEGQQDVFADPVFKDLTINGTPAVLIPRDPHAKWGVFRPGTPFRQTFRLR